MEPFVTSPQQRDASPSRIPQAQQQQDQVVTRMVDLDSRLADKLSRSTAGISPSRIPTIAPPPAAADKVLVPTSRRKHHDVDSHQHTRLQAAPINNSARAQKLKLLQHERLPKVLQSQQDTPNVTQQRQQSENLEPWEPQADWPQQLPQHHHHAALQQEQQHPAGQHPNPPGQHQHQRLQSRFPVPTKFQMQELHQHTTLPRIKQQQQQSPPRQSHNKQHAAPPSQEPSQQHHAHATAANSGWAASRKMHDFLLSQQRRKEAYWMNKYGRVVGPTAPESLGRPTPNPASMFRHPAATMLTANHSNSSNLFSRAGSQPLKLPVIGNSHSKTSLAAENSAQPDHANAVRAAEGGGLSSGWSTARNSGHGDIHDDSSSIFAGRRQSQHVAAQPVDSTQQQQQQQYDEADEAAFEQIKAKITLAAVPKLSVTTTLGRPVLPGIAGGAVSGRSTSTRQLPLRDLEAELQVLKAIKCREDAVDKLRSCCARLGGAVRADGAANMLLPTDPLGRLFYRLVSNLRLKTLDIIEAHAAWQRKISGASEPFTYRGKPYLPCLGGDLGFLDAAPWLVGKLLRCKAVEDCLLVELTPDGVPIDEVTSFDMRRGPSHFSAEALRIRMARKVLAAAGVQQAPATASSITAALQQQHQQQQLLHEVSSQLQHAAQPEVQSPCTTEQQQHQATMSAVTAALGILRRSSADGGEEAETVSITAADIWDQQNARTQERVHMEDNSSSSSRPYLSRAASGIGSFRQRVPQLKEPQLQHQGHMLPLASVQSPASRQQQQSPPGEPWMEQPPAQEHVEMQPQQVHYDQATVQHGHHRHTDSVVDDLLSTLVTQMQDQGPLLGPQQQLQHTAASADDLSVGPEANAEHGKAQVTTRSAEAEQQRQEHGHRLHKHHHTASVVDDLLDGLVADAEQVRPQSALWQQKTPEQGQQHHKHQHTDSVLEELLNGLVDDVEQTRPHSVQQHHQQVQQTGSGKAVMCQQQSPTSTSTGGHGAELAAVTSSSAESWAGVVHGRHGSSDTIIDSILNSLVDDIDRFFV